MTTKEEKARTEIFLAIEEEVSKIAGDAWLDLEKLLVNIDSRVKDICEKYHAVFIYCP